METIDNRYATELSEKPDGADGRTNATWTVNHPNFIKKEGQCIFWLTKIEIQATATRTIPTTAPAPKLYTGSFVNREAPAYRPSLLDRLNEAAGIPIQENPYNAYREYLGLPRLVRQTVKTLSTIR